MMFSTILQNQMFHQKIPVKGKIPSAVFQCTFLGKFVYPATALTSFAKSRRVWLASHIKYPTSSRRRPVALGFRLIELVRFETFLEQVFRTRTNAYITIHRKQRKSISNAAIVHYIAEIIRQLFDAGIGRIQLRVSFCFRVPIIQSANASLHVTKLLYRGSSNFACSLPEERHVVSQCFKSVSPCCYLISYSNKEITTL